ncbi:GGDEF domain-containing protein [Clostridium aminobutyricum]|uniref:GGDEF domain-containing protein n=1 Tax=Clostridium aminobutyricum TaxID=33953 RepID=A0A939D9K6_CLOAM|nr:GGDEF domain-containing protein [Clostridium aminobutyricum]MBN7773273.1 GGDEF domain-containing protein [Clostridium aminobutyricum]
MNVVTCIQNTIKANINLIVDTIWVNNSIMNEITLMNFKRISYFSVIGMIVNLTSIVVLNLNAEIEDQILMEWRKGIIISHSVLFIIFAVTGIWCFLIREKEKANFSMRFIQGFININTFIFGTIITFIDQLVTTNITPFLVACTITGAVFLMRPVFALILYLAAYAGFHYTIGLAQLSPIILLSDRINAITAIGIGFCISLIMWQTNKSSIIQKRVISTQQEVLEQSNLKLQTLAFYDSLTGLYSRRKFEELLQSEIYDILHHEHESCLIISDIDFFKEINDNYGHPIGDMVIKQMASLLKKNVRKTDSVARWGGDEFLILLPHTSTVEGTEIAEKLRKTIEKKAFFIKEKDIQVTSSFGVAGLKIDTTDTLEFAYKDADKALYSAKEKGRNRVETA